MNIFVAKLNYRTREDSLRELFESYGEVTSVKIVMDRDTGRSKGYGFVEMASDSEGENAINDLNDSDFDGQQIVVKKARPRNEYNNSRGGGRRY